MLATNGTIAEPYRLRVRETVGLVDLFEEFKSSNLRVTSIAVVDERRIGLLLDVELPYKVLAVLDFNQDG